MGGAVLDYYMMRMAPLLGGGYKPGTSQQYQYNTEYPSSPIDPNTGKVLSSPGDAHEEAGKGADKNLAPGHAAAAGACCDDKDREDKKKKLSDREKKVIDKAKKVKDSPEFNEMKGYAENGGPHPQTIFVDGTEIQYEPKLPASGMTMFGENGFVLGPEAFSSESEHNQTLLQENYRLEFSQVPQQGASNALVSQETNAAFNFAKQNQGLLK